MGSDPRRGPTPLIKPCCGSNPHTKQRKIGTDVSSGPISLIKKKKRIHLTPNKVQVLTIIETNTVAKMMKMLMVEITMMVINIEEITYRS